MGAFVRYVPWVVSAVAGAGLVAAGIAYLSLSSTQRTLEERYTQLETQFEQAQAELAASQKEAYELSASLAKERGRNDALNREVDGFSETVGALQRLAETDPELLQKYSKVYFLNEHYVPNSVVAIDEAYIYPEGTEESVHARVWPFLRELLEDAEEEGLELRVISGYRSYDQQASLKAAYRVTYGTGANTFSADQGYSEHQLGTAVDFTTPRIGSTFTGFDTTEEYTWLTQNAHKYGFVLSYPKGNAYYQYEPWHWRFVGTDLADTLHEDETYFYDLDQRDIDRYLIDIFE